MNFEGNYNCAGFHMTFANGLTASVQWGYGTYSDNRFNDHNESDTAEVAVIGVDGHLLGHIEDFLPESVESYDDEVAGYLTSDEVMEFLWKVKNYKM